MTAIDDFENHTAALISPAMDGLEVTPDDATDVTHVTRAIYVGGTGSIRVTLLSGVVVTFNNVPSGSLLPLRVSRIHATGTSATSLVGLF